MIEFLHTIAYIADSDMPGDDGQVYLSRVDNSYVGRVGLEDDDILKFLKKYTITHVQGRGGNTSCLGFSETEQKWYGWSHRATYGFGVGSEVNKGDCSYIAATPEGLIEDHVAFHADISEESADLHRRECQILKDRSGIRILHAPMFIPMANSIEDALDDDAELELVDLTADAVSIVKCGRGAWQAETLEDAREMATNFASGVN